MTITDLELRGLTCASCAARVERGLNRLDGVRAAVNFAVERAHVEHDPVVSARDLIDAVESAGYQASVRSDPPAVRDDRLLSRLAGSAAPALRLSSRTFRTIRTNLFWAFAYDAAAIPLAAAGLLTPMIAGAAMACSSLLVVANSLRLKRFR